MSIESYTQELNFRPFIVVAYSDAMYSIVKECGGVYYCKDRANILLLREFERLLSKKELLCILISSSIYRELVSHHSLKVVEDYLQARYLNGIRLDHLLDSALLKHYSRYVTKDHMLTVIKTVHDLARKEASQQLKKRLRLHQYPEEVLDLTDFAMNAYLHFFCYLPRKLMILFYTGE
jgi:hypothetical protein